MVFIFALCLPLFALTPKIEPLVSQKWIYGLVYKFEFLKTTLEDGD